MKLITYLEEDRCIPPAVVVLHIDHHQLVRHEQLLIVNQLLHIVSVHLQTKLAINLSPRDANKEFSLHPESVLYLILRMKRLLVKLSL